jgi:NADP-dependent 3-hydroxy acid dehydrogenase YdfG
MSDPKPLSGRRALVTGASSGFGAATALTLARAGAAVALTARRGDRLQALADDIAEAGGEAHVIVADFLRPEDVARAVDQAEAALGGLDILINNAGVMYLEPVMDADLGRWRDMIALNLTALIAASQAAARSMSRRGSGDIVNISSTAGRTANPNGGGYSATKWAVVGFSESLRKELVPFKVRVTVIEPGVAETELRDHVAHPQAKSSVDTWAASLRQLTAQDIANAILYAVSQPPHVCINEILMRPTDQER